MHRKITNNHFTSPLSLPNYNSQQMMSGGGVKMSAGEEFMYLEVLSGD